MAETRVSFRPLAEADLPLLHQWLNEPGILRWWEGDDVSWDGVVRDYGPARTDSNEHWIAEIGGAPIGWIQCWSVLDGLEESGLWFAHGAERTAAGIDYLIGDVDQRGMALGSAMIRAFVFDVVFGRHCDWTQAAASPYSANVASVRALAKAGFAEAGIITYPDDEVPCTLMVFDRPRSSQRGVSQSAEFPGPLRLNSDIRAERRGPLSGERSGDEGFFVGDPAL